MIDSKSHPIIVLGVERSGTSVVAEMLHRWVLIKIVLKLPRFSGEIQNRPRELDQRSIRCLNAKFLPNANTENRGTTDIL